MPGSNTVTLAGLAKEIFPINEIADEEQRVTALSKEIEKDSDLQFSAKDGGAFTFPVKANGPHGQKMMNEQESLANARSSRVVQGEAKVKEYAGVLQFTKREMELAQKDPQSFANAKTFEMKNLIENAHKYFNRQVANGDGSGKITTVVGAVAGPTIQLPVLDATPFQIGMVLDIFNAAGTLKLYSEVVVVDVDILSAQNTIDLDTSVTSIPDLAILCISGVLDNASTDGKEMIGLPLVTDDGTVNASFQGIVRTGSGEVPNYRGIQVDAGNVPISVALVNQLMTRAFRIAGTDFVKLNDVYWCMSPEQWRAYSALSVPQIRFQPTDAADMNKPFTQYELAGKRVVLDTDVSRTRAYLIKKDAIKMGVATQLDWEEDLGGTSLKWLSGYLQGVMVLYSLQQLFSQAPRDIAALTNLAAVQI